MNSERFYRMVMTVVFTILGIAIGFVGYMFYQYYPDYRGLLFVGIAVGSIVIVCVFYYLYFEKEITEHLRELTSQVISVADGENPLIAPSGARKDLEGLYEAIDQLRKNLRQQNRSKDTVLSIVNTLATNIELEKMLEALLPKLADGTKSIACAFYSFNPVTNKLELKSSVGFSKNIYQEFDVGIGEGIIGTVASSKKIQVITELPKDTVFISRTFLGKVMPRSLMVVPVLSQGELVAVIALSSILGYGAEQLEIIKMIRYYLGVAFSNGLAFERTQRLTNELQFQNQLIQNMNEELENKILERTEFVNNIIDSIQDYAIISTNLDLVISTWNKGAEVLIGYPDIEALSTKITDLSAFSHMRETVETHFAHTKEKGSYSTVGWRRRKDGSTFFADVTINTMNDTKGDIIGYSVVMKDITELKNYENVLRE